MNIVIHILGIVSLLGFISGIMAGNQKTQDGHKMGPVFMLASLAYIVWLVFSG